MHDNIGKKIKVLAKVLTWIGIIASIICGIVMMASGNGMLALIGIVVAIFGSVVSWVSSFLLYGFGELIDKVSDIERNTGNTKRDSKVRSKKEPERVDKLKNLRARGLITEEEYDKKRKEYENDEFVDLICPECEAELSYTKDQVKNSDNLICPMCDAVIVIH